MIRPLAVAAATMLAFSVAGCTSDPEGPPEKGPTVSNAPSTSIDEGKQILADAISTAQRSLEPTVAADQWQIRNGVGIGNCPDPQTTMFFSDIHSTPHEITSDELHTMTSALGDLGFTLPPEADVIPGKLTKQTFTHADGYILNVMSGDGRGTRMSGETPCLARSAEPSSTTFSQEN